MKKCKIIDHMKLKIRFCVRESEGLLIEKFTILPSQMKKQSDFGTVWQ